MFGGGGVGGSTRRSRRNGPMKGQDREVPVTIDFTEAIFGCKKEIELTKNVKCASCNGEGTAPGTGKKTCPSCGGSGQVVRQTQSLFGMTQTVSPCPDCRGTGQIIESPCPDCRGSGQIRKKLKIKVDIPAGVDNDNVITLRGQGEPGLNGGPNGDLYIITNVRPHSTYKRKGDDLFIDLPVSFDQAALGAKVTIPGFNEAYSYSIPAGTQTGSSFRLKGKGVRNPRTGRMGDLFVKVIVEVPTKLSATEKKAIKARADQMSDDAYPKKSRFQKLKF